MGIGTLLLFVFKILLDKACDFSFNYQHGTSSSGPQKFWSVFQQKQQIDELLVGNV